MGRAACCIAVAVIGEPPGVGLVDDVLAGIGGGNGTLTADQFVKNTTGLAGDGNDHIIYETDTGWLTYDSNGSAAGGSTHFATLAANLALTNADFVVV
ncbi:hypothetical protein ACFSQT_07890 [Mesorhizobium calcicola]|uniref:Calcium-binding protein n=1 Tax=Mesorhizobium calcicola TaxID=1300310 RepID=A0ABW4WCA0_9HYPH